MKTTREYRCPNCGSSALRVRSRGYDVGQAAWGSALLGKHVGLLAGAVGKEKPMLQCIECGYSFYAWNYDKELIRCAERRRTKTFREKLSDIVIWLGLMSLVGLIVWAIFGGMIWALWSAMFGFFFVCLLIVKLCIGGEQTAQSSQQPLPRGGKKKPLQQGKGRQQLKGAKSQRSGARVGGGKF